MPLEIQNPPEITAAIIKRTFHEDFDHFKQYMALMRRYSVKTATVESNATIKRLLHTTPYRLLVRKNNHYQDLYQHQLPNIQRIVNQTISDCFESQVLEIRDRALSFFSDQAQTEEPMTQTEAFFRLHMKI